jgi:glycosyltransferase involved in cell wall biosynthesis
MDMSVVIPAYRSGHLVGRAVRSALDEGVDPHDIIVVEDGVTDDTADVVGAFTGTRLVSLDTNGGAPRARNIGLSFVRTPHVMFLDADDFVESGLLPGLDAAIRQRQTDIAVGPWLYHGDGRKRGQLRCPQEQATADWMLNWVNGLFFPPCCVAWKADSVRAIGGWDERLKKDQDGELMVRAFTRGLTVAVSDAGNGVYWQHASEGRLTRSAQIEHITASADIVYEQIVEWLGQGDRPDHLAVALGRHCCKMAWVAYSFDRADLARQWQKRAAQHGYFNKGYSHRTSLLAGLLGVRLSARIKTRTRGDSLYLKAIAQR